MNAHIERISKLLLDEAHNMRPLVRTLTPDQRSAAIHQCSEVIAQDRATRRVAAEIVLAAIRTEFDVNTNG
jgi:hypothetical protein